MKHVYIYTLLYTSFVLTGCASKELEYALDYPSCKEMRQDKSHPYWKEPIAIQGCEFIIFEEEVGKAPTNAPGSGEAPLSPSTD